MGAVMVQGRRRRRWNRSLWSLWENKLSRLRGECQAYATLTLVQVQASLWSDVDPVHERRS